MPTLEEKIEELQEEQQKALKELEAAQLKGNELNALIQRQTGAIRVLLDLKAEQSESLRQDVSNGEVEAALSA
jgi:DNA recombination-dependent growth factor C